MMPACHNLALSAKASTSLPIARPQQRSPSLPNPTAHLQHVPHQPEHLWCCQHIRHGPEAGGQGGLGPGQLPMGLEHTSLHGEEKEYGVKLEL